MALRLTTVNAKFLSCLPLHSSTPSENSFKRIHVDSSKRKSSFTGRTNTVLGSFNVIDRTSSPFDGWTLITLAKSQNDHGVLLSYSKTMLVTLTFCCTLFHFFFIMLSDGIYSLINYFQYMLDRLSTIFHLRRLSIFFSLISTIPCAFKDLPDIKWFGVNTVKLSVSSLIDVKGRLLIVPSFGTRVWLTDLLEMVSYLSLTSTLFLLPSLTNSKLHPSMDYLVVWSVIGCFDYFFFLSGFSFTNIHE